MKHIPVPGDHSLCTDGCRITGQLCCGGQDEGICEACDERRLDDLLAADAAGELVSDAAVDYYAERL